MTDAVRDWYTATKDTFTNATSLYQGLLTTIEGFVARCGARNRTSQSKRTMYGKDPVILTCQQNLAIYQRRWQQDPTNVDARDAMVTAARHLTDLRQQVRKKYWDDFLASVRNTKSLRGIWYHVNRVRGKGRHFVSDPDPMGKAKSFLYTWTAASALAGLPAAHKATLAQHRPHRLNSINHNLHLFL